MQRASRVFRRPRQVQRKPALTEFGPGPRRKRGCPVKAAGLHPLAGLLCQNRDRRPSDRRLGRLTVMRDMAPRATRARDIATVFI